MARRRESERDPRRLRSHFREAPQGFHLWSNIVVRLSEDFEKARASSYFYAMLAPREGHRGRSAAWSQTGSRSEMASGSSVSVRPAFGTVLQLTTYLTTAPPTPLVVVSALTRPSLHIEVQATAAIPRRSTPGAPAVVTRGRAPAR